MTAIANDISYEDIFSEQMKNLLDPGDVVIAITGSGNSKNILKAVDFAREKKARIIGFIGFGGGKLKERVDCAVTFSSRDYGLVETVHLYLDHLFTFYLKKRFQET